MNVGEVNVVEGIRGLKINGAHKIHNSKVVAGILAAGVAKRLEPISAIIAKPMFPLGGKYPICQNWAERLERVGIDQIGMNLHRVPDSITSYFGDGSQFNVQIHYVHEETPSGTLGGAIKMLDLLKQNLGGNFDTIIVPSGDVISEMSDEAFSNMLSLHKKKGAAVSMLLTPVSWDMLGEFGTVNLKHLAIKKGRNAPDSFFAQITEFREKDPNSPSNLNNASCYIIERSFLEELKLTGCTPDRNKVPEPFYDFGQHVFPAMLGNIPYKSEMKRFKDSLFGFVSQAPWFDVGRKRDYLKVNQAVLNKEINLPLPYNKRPWGWIGNAARIASDVTIEAPVIIGNNCEIMSGATIGPNAIIGDGWYIGNNAKISNTVTWEYMPFSKIPSHREIRENSIIDNSILVGGSIGENLTGKVVDILPDGKLVVGDIDAVPQDKRA